MRRLRVCSQLEQKVGIGILPKRTTHLSERVRKAGSEKHRNGLLCCPSHKKKDWLLELIGLLEREKQTSMDITAMQKQISKVMEANLPLQQQLEAVLAMHY